MEDLANVLAGCRRALDSYGFTTASEGVQRAETELARLRAALEQVNIDSTDYKIRLIAQRALRGD